MGLYFDDHHAPAENQLGGKPYYMRDSEAVAALRGAQTYEEYMELAAALNWQLRYREAAEVYTKAIELDPNRSDAVRQRAPRYLASLQTEKAVADFERSLELGCERGDTLYRLGIAYYLNGQFEQSMAAEAEAYTYFDEEMGIAAMYWNTFAALKAGKEPELAKQYYVGMKVGHHTAYDAVMALFTDHATMDETIAKLEAVNEDLEFAMMGFGTAMIARQRGMEELCDDILYTVVKHDSFWIGYGYIAAWQAYFSRD